MNSKGKIFFIGYTIIYIFAFIIFCIFAKKECIEQETFETGKLLFLLLPVIMWALISVKDYFMRTIKSARSCGDILFDELDYYKNHWTESNEHYQTLINAINYYYKKDGKIDRVIGNDLKRLYNRLDFLKRGMKSNEYLFTCISSVGLSVFASLFMKTFAENIVTQIFCMIVVLVLWMAILLLNYDKSFKNENAPIYEYELKLLEEKIVAAEKSILVDYQCEDMMLTKQHVLSELIKKCGKAFGKKKKDIINDIKTVEKINLTVSDVSKYEKLTFFVGKKKQCVLLLDKNNKFATEQYRLLYLILRKYNMIYELNEDRDDIQ